MKHKNGISEKRKLQILLILSLVWVAGLVAELHAQDPETVDTTIYTKESSPLRLLDAQDEFLREQDRITINSLTKGTFTVGLGAFLDEDRNRNKDAWVYYILDEKKSRMNVRLSLSYFTEDKKSVGFAFRYIRGKNTTEYLDTFGDTTLYTVKDNGYDVSLFRKVHSPIFGSKRVYFITQPELSYKFQSTETERTYWGLTSDDGQRKHSVTAGFQVGIMIFPFEGFSLEAKLGPLGVGYSWENFYESGNQVSKSENFFIHLVPRITTVSFTMTSYF